VSFTQTAGIYEMKTFLAEKTAKYPDGIPFAIQIRGTGNIRHLRLPPIQFSPDFQMMKMEEDVQVHIDWTNGRIDGIKTFTFYLLPQKRGDLTIPAVNFSYFNLEAETYKRLSDILR